MAHGMDKALMALMGIDDDNDDDISQPLQSLEHDHHGSSPDQSPLSSPDRPHNPQSTVIDTTRRYSPPTRRDTKTAAGAPQLEAHPSSSPGSPSSPHSALPRASTSSLFASHHRADSPPLFSPDFNPFNAPTGKVRVAKSAKKKSVERDASSMFSPTLSPRKVKKKPFSRPSGDTSPDASSALVRPRSASISSPTAISTRAPSTKPTIARAAAKGPTSPVSSFVLKRKVIDFSDTDSDISPLEDDRPSSSSLARHITLSVSLPSDMDTEMLSPTKTSIATANNSLLDQLDDGSENENLVDADIAELTKASKPSKAASKKLLEDVHKETARMMRTTSMPQIQRTVKRDLTSLLRQHQSKLQNESSTSVPSDPTLAFPPSPAKSRPHAIVLDDDSEDEAEDTAFQSKEFQEWRLTVLKAMLATPVSRESRRQIELQLQRPSLLTQGMRLEIERTLQMNPLSSEIQSLSLNGNADPQSQRNALLSPSRPSAPGARPFGSPSKSQRPTTSWTQFKEESRRMVAKVNLRRHNRQVEDAKKSGIWKTPEEFAAEQLKTEEKRSRGLDPDEDEHEQEEEPGMDGDDEDENEDESYLPDKASAIDALEDEDDDERDLGSGDEAIVGGTSEEDNGDNNNNNSGDDGSEGSDDDSNHISDDSGDDDEMESKVVGSKRSSTKRALIDDADDIKISVVDHGQMQASDSGLSTDNTEESGSDNNSGDDDVSDMDDALEDNGASQGFGAFFQSSFGTSRPKEKDMLATPYLDQDPTPSSVISPVIESDLSQSPSSNRRLSGALSFLSGNFAASATPESSDPATVPGTAGSESKEDSSFVAEDDLMDQTAPGKRVSAPKNAFDVLTRAMQSNNLDSSQAEAPRRRRLHQREAKPGRVPVSKNEKSAFIEYEAEEEEDEFMGMGGVDYESDNDQDEYDLGDGMVDRNEALHADDVEKVRLLHMKQVQEQDDKDVSDLVHGIAAGNLWKRRNGQMEDLDIFDEGDMDGRFQRKKKLKVSEKFEKLADNPNTAAFARAFEKNVVDDQIIFLSDPDESNDEADASTNTKDKIKARDDDGDDGMAPSDSDEDMSQDEVTHDPTPWNRYDGDNVDDDEDEDEPLNTDKRKERQRMTRQLNNGEEVGRSPFSGRIDALTREQALPFGVMTSESLLTPGSESPSSPPTSTAAAKHSMDSLGLTFPKPLSQLEAPIDDYKDAMRRSKTIRDIIDGVDDISEIQNSQESASQRRTLPSSFDVMDRIIDRPSLTELSGSRASRDGDSVGVNGDIRSFAGPRTLSRQNSSFISDERRNYFLNTVGEEDRGGQASNRVVKDVNRRRMAFATSKKPASSSTTSGSTTTSGTKSNAAISATNPRAINGMAGFKVLKSVKTTITTVHSSGSMSTDSTSQSSQLRGFLVGEDEA
ncbi:hypothetical protein BGZ99_006369 [Dissophora globulifera]|uniref:DNA replication checkpoint mediator MRC1 domain-containing protein n=1 Tax=Dissophora globulifera TaxID=979702 RepID=A0A9P6RS74_9FUNG|nr:hypothetical protein BGZ99_006369 [Dissophora globulifera]